MSKDNNLLVYGSIEDWSEFEIVARHPLADQNELLEQLNLTPSECRICDVWWKIANHLPLVCVTADTRCKTTFAFKDIDSGPRFYVRVDCTQLNTSDINKILNILATWISENKLTFESTSDESVLICHSDILNVGKKN